MTSARLGLTLSLLFTALAAPAAADTPLHDRRPYMGPGTYTTDDPLRIPVRPPGEPGAEIVLTNGRVLDVEAGTVEAASIVIHGNRIKAVLPEGSTDWSPDARVIDVSGKTVMPGLIDMHTHVTYPDRDTPPEEQANEGSAALLGQRNLRYFLESGITSVRDVNGVSNVPYLLSAWSAANKIPSPRVFTAGHMITGTGGHANERPLTPKRGPEFAWEVDGPDAWREAVRKVFKAGGSVVKIASHFSADEVAAAVDEAHLLGLVITCDCETIYTQMAIEAGVDMIEHPLPRSDESIRLMAKKGISSIPTMQVYHDLFARVGGYYGSTSRRFSMSSEMHLAMAKKLKAAGVVQGIGTDTIGPAARSLPYFYIAELQWFLKAGYSRMEVLQAATIVNARLLDMDDKLGSLEVGKLADVIVVDGRPDENIDDLANIDIVVKDGILLVQSGVLVPVRRVPEPLVAPVPMD